MLLPEVLYIQHLNKDNENKINSFDNIIAVLSELDDPITVRFTISLEKWKVDVSRKFLSC